MRPTRFATILGVFTAGALALTGCAGSGGTPGPAQSVASAATDLTKCTPSENTINVTFGQQAADAMKVAVSKVQSDYPGLTINATPQATVKYDDLTKTIVGDIAVGKRPDLIMSGLGQLRFWVDEYKPATIETSKLPSTYQKQFLTAGTVDGKTYLAPAQISAPVLLVNRKLLDEAGAGTASGIKTYADLVAAAKKVTEKTGQPSVTVPTQAIADWLSQAFVQGAGGTYVNKDGAAGFGDSTGVEALSIWSALAKDKLEAGIGDQDAVTAFASGKTAFSVTSSAIIATMKKTIGDKFDWDAVDLPSANGRGGALPAGGNGWVVLSDNACRAGYANALVSALLSKDAVLAASGAAYSYIPVDSAAAQELLSGTGVSKQQKYAWSYDKTLTEWGGFNGKTLSQVNDTLKQTAQALQSGADAKTTVQQAVTAVNSILGKG